MMTMAATALPVLTNLRQTKSHRSTMQVSLLLLSLLWLVLFTCPVNATKHSFNAAMEKRSLIGPVGVPFGFLEGGHFELTVFDFELSIVRKRGDDVVSTDRDEDILKKVEAGFFLQRYKNEAAFEQHLEVLKANSSLCAFDYFRNDDDDEPSVFGALGDDNFEEPKEIQSAANGILLSMKDQKKWKPATPNIEYTFKKGESGLYFLVYQVCPPNAHVDIRSTFELDFLFSNVDSFGNESFLTAGEMRLPLIFFFFSISYLLCFMLWFTNIRGIQNLEHFKSLRGARAGGGGGGASGGANAPVYAIHHLMSVLLLLKFLSIFSESIRYHAIRISGHAEIWSVVYYIFTFVKGTFLFTVILLIGSGWSFVKPFLSDREKKVIFMILVLQIVNNIALTVLSNETEGETSYEGWTATLHLVDIVCCCAVLVPIVWQVNALEKSVEVDEVDEQDEEEREMGLASGEKGEILSKLKLFRSFYLLVVVYIYSTRILIYLFATMLDYKHLWLRYVVIEVVTLAFYVTVGLMFKPSAENPYLSVKRDEEDSSLQRGLELKNVTGRSD